MAASRPMTGALPHSTPRSATPGPAISSSRSRASPQRQFELRRLLIVMCMFLRQRPHLFLDLSVAPLRRSTASIVVLHGECVMGVGLLQVRLHPVDHGALHATLRHASYRPAARLPQLRAAAVVQPATGIPALAADVAIEVMGEHVLSGGLPGLQHVFFATRARIRLASSRVIREGRLRPRWFQTSRDRAPGHRCPSVPGLPDAP